MKKVLILVFFASFSLSGYSQNPPTIREIYNFSVNDTFEFGRSYRAGGQEYFFEIITGRSDYGNDSIVYTVKICYPTSISYESRKFEWLDSYLGFNGVSIVSGDTVYLDSSSYSTTIYCNLAPQDIYAYISSETRWRVGMGQTGSTYIVDAIPCWSGMSTGLIYAHKFKQKPFGVPQYFIVGINDLAMEIDVNLYPNPATRNFELKLSEQPTSKTYLQLFDGLGRIVKQEEISSTITNIERGNLSNGMYYWQIMTCDKVVARNKLILN